MAKFNILNIKNLGNPIIYVIFILTLTIIYSALYNIQLFRNHYPSEYLTILFLISIARDAVIWYIAGLNRWVFAVFAPIMFAFAAGLDYFVRTVKLGIGIGAFELLFQTNVKEAAGVINPLLVKTIIMGLIISAIFVAIRFYIGGVKNNKTKLLLLAIFIVPVFLGKMPEEALKEVKYGKGQRTERGVHVMPEKIVENLYHYALNQYRLKKLFRDRKNTPLPQVGYDDQGIDTSVFILTDALRPDHMSINGYGRQTTPNMMQLDFTSFAPMYACETSTTRSVPCLITRASRNQPINQYLKEPSFLTMFKAAGFDTAWISSQGSVSTSDTGPSVVASDADYTFFNDGVNTLGRPIYDSDLLPELDKFLQRKGNKKLVVLHLNGSHWDYSTRYTDQQKTYVPDCRQWVYDCTQEEVVNAYDNTIIATDELVQEVVEKVKDKNALIFFTSDHGQFLGEHNRYIHSHELLEFKELAEVPFAVWKSPSLNNNEKLQILETNTHKITSHDNIFHTVTHCGGISSNLIDENLSLCNKDIKSLEAEF